MLNLIQFQYSIQHSLLILAAKLVNRAEMHNKNEENPKLYFKKSLKI